MLTFCATQIQMVYPDELFSLFCLQCERMLVSRDVLGEVCLRRRRGEGEGREGRDESGARSRTPIQVHGCTLEGNSNQHHRTLNAMSQMENLQ